MPPWINVRLVAQLAIAAALFFAGWGVNGWRLGVKIEHREAEIAQTEAVRAEVATKAEAAARYEEARRQAAQQEVIHVATLARTRADTDHAAVVADRDRLLDAFRAAPAGGGTTQDPAAAPGGQAAATTVDLRADVFGWAVDAAAELAAALDAAHVAGLACQQSYGSLTSIDTQTPP